MIGTRLRWLLGLPCVGKTTNLGNAFARLGFSYIQADQFRQRAWEDLLARDGHAAALYDKCFVVAYAHAFLDLPQFVALHTSLAPHLIARILRHVDSATTQDVVVEISSLYRRFIPSQFTQLSVSADGALHRKRIAKRLAVDDTLANAVYWGLHRAQHRLNDGIAPVALIDIGDEQAIMEQLT